MSQTMLKDNRLKDTEERTRINQATAAVYDSTLVASRNSAVALIDEGNALEEQGRIAEAMARYDAAIQADPQCARAHLNRGNILAGAQCDEARRAYQLAITCDPHYAAAHFNLGNLNYHAGEFELALRNYQTAIGIKPDFADAFVAMANALDCLGRTAEAVESYERALVINPDYAEVHFNLGLLVMTQGRHVEAVNSLCRAIEIKPTWTTKVAFANCVACTKFTTNDSRIRAALTTAITEPWGMPYELAWPALSLIMLDERIASCVRLANGSWPLRLPKAALFGPDGLAALAADPLLHALLEAVPVNTIEFERFLTCARHALLETASNKLAPDHPDVAALQFYAALSRQCFINEYIFDRDDRELIAATACRTKLLALLDANEVVPPFLVLAVAAYFPLNTIRNASRLLAASVPGQVDEVLRQQIREPLEEQALRAGVKCLTSITSGVSEEVRDQYEQNPYPRWVKIPMNKEPLHFNDELRRTLPFATFTPMPDDSAPDVLIAGCGTGCHSILAAQRFRGARVLAIDLSLSSISYAKRKTQELGMTNIEYAQADILNIGDIACTFDIIESGGVLHHLADPFMGWRTLLSRLRPGGFMCLGFYSALARRHVVKAREFIAARGYASTPDDIRRFRQDQTLKDMSVELQSLGKMSDFYSTSNCRDLLFHVQEHRLTLGQVESFLAEFGLDFIGFQLDPNVLRQYRARFPDDPSGTNLRNWARFEADNPDTFLGMYQFWIQKPIIDRRSSGQRDLRTGGAKEPSRESPF
jgi:tetratricopeptide (TPR) repeat protein/2-polyprenyl-3-methyl-5-hydroxy-6-metoxy-1,4-benzoquinol methylase